MKILIVDDNSNDRKVLRYVLQAHGHSVVEAVNGMDGLRAASAHTFDLILSDVLMPVMDGFQFLRNIRESNSIPFVFYSAVYDGNSDMQLAASLGANGYLIKPEDPLKVMKEIERIVGEASNESSGVIVEHADFLERHSLVVASKLEDKVRELEEAVVERSWAEEALRASEERYRLLVELSPDLIFIRQEEWIVYANPAAARMVGANSTEELIGRSVLDFALPERREYLRMLIDANNAKQIGEVTASYEGTLVRLDGSLVPIELTAVRFYYRGMACSQLIMHDITERRQAEQERLAHLKFLENMDRVNRAIQGGSDLEPMMSDVLDAVLSIFDCDRAFFQYPCDPEAATWRVPMRCNRPKYPGVRELGLEMPMDPHAAETFRILLASDGPVQFGPEGHYPLPTDVTERFGFKSFMAMALHPKTGMPWQFGIHQCSSPRVWSAGEEKLLQEIGWRLADALTAMLTHRDLQENERRLALIKFALDNTQESAYLCDTLGHFIYVNDEACRSLGYSQHELYGMAVDDIICDFPSGDWAQHVCDLMARGSLTFEASQKSRDGRIIPVELNVKYFKHNDTDYILSLARDISERKLIEEALLVKQQKLTNMAVELSMAEERERRRIAGELHDNISQTLLLGKIKLRSLIDVHPATKGKNELEEILNLQNQMIQSVRSLTQQLSPPILALAGLEDALEWLGERMMEDYGLRVVLVDDQSHKPLSKDMRAIVFQACRELLINVAKHAETESARVIVGREGDRFYLAVEDQGMGFDLAESAHASSWDLGFGLFSIKERIKYLGGEVKIESAPGQGTRITLWMALEGNNE